jgi:hypothetical protein
MGFRADFGASILFLCATNHHGCVCSRMSPHPTPPPARTHHHQPLLPPPTGLRNTPVRMTDGGTGSQAAVILGDPTIFGNFGFIAAQQARYSYTSAESFTLVALGGGFFANTTQLVLDSATGILTYQASRLLPWVLSAT